MNKPGASRPWRTCLGILLVCLGTSSLSLAHPMGNFSINHYSKITVQQGSVEVHYLIDAAEIPTFQEMQQNGFTADPQSLATRKYLSLQGEALKKNLVLKVGGNPSPLDLKSTEVIFPPGAGGLPTMKMSFVYSAKLSAQSAGADPEATSLYYRDDNFPSRIGWKEVVAVAGTGVNFLHASVSSQDRSSELSNYPTDLLNSPPHDLEASITFELLLNIVNGETGVPPVFPGGDARHSIARGVVSHRSATSSSATTKATSLVPNTRESGIAASETSQLPNRFAPAPQTSVLRANQQRTPKNRFTELMTAKPFSIWFLLMAAGIAAALGAMHALEPGHGKTIVAAYLVGSRGTARHAVLLGFVVTAAHTAGVFLLGALTLYASQYIVPEQLYPWLGAISGATVAGIGILILLRHLTGETTEHSHADGNHRSHWFFSKVKTSDSRPEKRVSLRELLALGVTGGIVPCPAALVVLLSAFSLHRIGFGLFLITSFSFGLALVLVIIGLTMVYTKRFMSRFKTSNPLLRYLPVLSSSFMVILGVGIAVSAFSSFPVAHYFISKDKLVPFITVVLLGLFLGMRHSTDPDHVVAVSTIVSRHKSIKHSAMIGLLWGLGHSLTIFLVGAVIIFFGVVIPPRLGLSMEFSVALMLILLGVLNLAGVMRWITERFTPSLSGSEAARANSLTLATRRETLAEKTIGKLGLYQTLRPFVIGLVHGLAGSAAVALLVLSTIKSPGWATAYLLVFGAGTMVGMMLMTTAIAMPLAYTGKKFLGANRFMTTTSGILSTAFGLFLVYHIGLVDGLFRAQTHWIPQ